MNKKFELLKSSEENKKLIIYSSDNTFNGFILNKKELYELFCLLREEFKNE